MMDDISSALLSDPMGMTGGAAIQTLNLPQGTTGGGDTMSPISALLSGQGDLSQTFNKENIQALLKDPKFMMALQMMMGSQQPDMMKMASQMAKSNQGGLGGLGGVTSAGTM